MVNEEDASTDDGSEHKLPDDTESITSHWNLSEDYYIETETDEEDQQEDSYGCDRFVEITWQCQECATYNNHIESICL